MFNDLIFSFHLQFLCSFFSFRLSFSQSHPSPSILSLFLVSSWPSTSPHLSFCLASHSSLSCTPFSFLCPSFSLQSLLELVFGVKVVITGDGFVPGERSVIIMNHRTRLDWMFLWCCLLRYSYLRLEKVCLKAALKAVPGFGVYTAGVLPLPDIQITHSRTSAHAILLL